MPKQLKDNHTDASSQPLGFITGTYLERTSRPIYALVFLLPFMALYEIGTILISTTELSRSQVRVIAFVWLQDFLEYLGFSLRFTWLITPLVVVLVLLGMHIASKRCWSVRIKDCIPMAIECVMLAIPLVVLSLVLNQASHMNSFAAVNSAKSDISAIPLAVTFCQAVSDAAGNNFFIDVVTGIGAGIYEELVFRLFLICVLMFFFQDVLSFTRRNSVIISVLLSAALFSAHHHLVFINGHISQITSFTWPQFIFRTIAGIYFAALFALRGFGVTAGTHVFYDTIAAFINFRIFTPDT